MKKLFIVILFCSTSACQKKPSPPPTYVPNINRHTGPATTRSTPQSMPTTGSGEPLKAQGIGSLASMRRDLSGLKDAGLKSQFERAYRMTFCIDKTRRNYGSAKIIFGAVIKQRPKFAPAYRGYGYAVFNITLNMDAAASWYRKALAVDSRHGESHYALAFILGAQSMQAKRKGEMVVARQHYDSGKKHLNSSKQLGVRDERSIGASFYSLRP